MNDSTIELAEIIAVANRETFLKKRGTCCHGFLQEKQHPVHAPELKPGQVKCRDCGTIFPSLADCMDERDERLS